MTARPHAPDCLMKWETMNLIVVALSLSFVPLAIASLGVSVSSRLKLVQLLLSLHDTNSGLLRKPQLLILQRLVESLYLALIANLI